MILRVQRTYIQPRFRTELRDSAAPNPFSFSLGVRVLSDTLWHSNGVTMMNLHRAGFSKQDLA
jgi:hypothetical protein